MARDKLLWSERLRSAEPKDRRDALRDASKIGDRAAVNAAIGSLSDKDRTVRLEAARALAHIGGDPAMDALLPLLDEPEHDHRVALAKIVRSMGEAPIDRLKNELGRADFTARPRFLRRLLALGIQTPLAAYLRALVAPQKEKRDEAVELLKQVVPFIHAIDVAGELLGAIGDAVGARDPRALEIVSHVVSQLRDPAATELLAAGLYHPDAGVRKAAVDALNVQGWIPRTDAERVTFDLARGDDRSLARLGADAVEPLRILVENGCSDLRASAARSLGLLRRTGAEDALGRVLFDPIGAVRAAAVNALCECTGPRCARDLARLLKDPDESVRHAVEHALGRMGEPVRPLLTELAVSSDSAVRSRASRILAGMGGGPAAKSL